MEDKLIDVLNQMMFIVGGLFFLVKIMQAVM